jgi:hypothetical protein
MMKRGIDSTPRVAQYALASLHAGDILLSTNPDSIESMVIRVATRSPFSHAAIYDGSLNFYEAADTDVLNFNYMRYGIFSKDNVRVLRLKSSIEGHGNIALSAARAAEKYREREYWTPGAIASAFRLLVPNEREGFFCSFLVASCYQEAGCQICNGLRPQEVTPGDIARSENLEDVTEIALYDLPSWDRRPCLIDLSNGALDECRDAPSIQLAFARKMILREIRPLFENAHIGSPSTLDDALIAFINDGDKERQKKLDIEISEILARHHYVELPGRYFSKLLVVSPFKRDQYSEMPLEALTATIELHKELKKKWLDRANGWRAQEALASAAFEKAPLSFLRLHRDYCHSNAEVVEAGVLSISNHITNLEKYCDEVAH